MAPSISRIFKRLFGTPSPPKRVASAISDPAPAMERALGGRQSNRRKSETDGGNFPGLFRRLSRRDDAPGRAEAYALLRQILSNASVHDLCRFEALCRERSRAEPDMEWSRFPSDGFCPEGVTSDDRVWGYALASLHPNGFLREKAVTGLASIGTGEEIPFLLLRMRDWVDQVRARAESAMDARLRTAHGDAASRVLRALPIMKRLLASKRLSSVQLLERVGKRIASDRKALLSGLESADMDTRKFCFGLASGEDGIGPEALQEAVLREPQGTVRLFALRAMVAMEKQLAFPQAEGFISSLLRDPFAPVRRLSLDIRCKHALDESGGVLREMVLSPNGGVRQTARFYMSAASREKPLSLYREALAGGNGSSLLGALRGLGEVGERQDAELLHPFLKHGRTAVVRAAIRSLGSLQAGFLATLLTPYLCDSRPGVSREAVLALKSRTAGLNPDRLNAARKSSALPHVRKHILMLLCAIGYWESLPYILDALSDAKAGGKEEERVSAEKALARWILRSNSYFIKPDKGSMERCRESLARSGTFLDGNTRKVLAFILR